VNHSAWENEEVKEMVGRKEKEEEGGERQGDKSMSVKGAHLALRLSLKKKNKETVFQLTT